MAKNKKVIHKLIFSLCKQQVIINLIYIYMNNKLQYWAVNIQNIIQQLFDGNKWTHHTKDWYEILMNIPGI